MLTSSHFLFAAVPVEREETPHDDGIEDTGAQTGTRQLTDDEIGDLLLAEYDKHHSDILAEWDQQRVDSIYHHKGTRDVVKLALDTLKVSPEKVEVVNKAISNLVNQAALGFAVSTSAYKRKLGIPQEMSLRACMNTAALEAVDAILVALARVLPMHADRIKCEWDIVALATRVTCAFRRAYDDIGLAPMMNQALLMYDAEERQDSLLDKRMSGLVSARGPLTIANVGKRMRCM